MCGIFCEFAPVLPRQRRGVNLETTRPQNPLWRQHNKILSAAGISEQRPHVKMSHKQSQHFRTGIDGNAGQHFGPKRRILNQTTQAPQLVASGFLLQHLRKIKLFHGRRGLLREDHAIGVHRREAGKPRETMEKDRHGFTRRRLVRVLKIPLELFKLDVYAHHARGEHRFGVIQYPFVIIINLGGGIDILTVKSFGAFPCAVERGTASDEHQRANQGRRNKGTLQGHTTLQCKRACYTRARASRRSANDSRRDIN